MVADPGAEIPAPVAGLLEEFVQDVERGGDPDPEVLAQRLPTDAERREFVALVAEYRSLQCALPHGGGTHADLKEYAVEEEIGRGGMGVVFRARDARGHVVALKTLPESMVRDPDALRRFEHETEVLRGIAHPHLVRVHGHGRDENAHFLVMEHLPGGSLERRIHARAADPRPRRAAEVAEACSVVAKIARAAAEAHRHGVVHRDVKPSNVLFDAQGEPRLVDFGLARIQDGPTLTADDQILGTVPYLAPERVFDPRSRDDPRVDVYSLGVTLFEALTGTRPFHGTLSETIAAARVGAPPLFTYLGSAADRRLQVILDRAVAFHPAERYASADAFADDLEAWIAGSSVRAMRGARLRRWRSRARRRPRAFAAGLLAVLALGAFGGTRIVDAQRRASALAAALTPLDGLLSALDERAAEIEAIRFETLGVAETESFAQIQDRQRRYDAKSRAAREILTRARAGADEAARVAPGSADAREATRAVEVAGIRLLESEGRLLDSWRAWRSFAASHPDAFDEQGLAELRVAGIPQGARLVLERFAWERDGEPWPREEVARHDGGGDWQITGLEPGSYVVSVEDGAGSAPIPLPLVLRGGEEGALRVPDLPPAERREAGWAWVAGGEFLAGGDPRTADAGPPVVRSEPAFFIATDELLFREYWDFLVDLYDRNGGRCISPRHGEDYATSTSWRSHLPTIGVPEGGFTMEDLRSEAWEADVPVGQRVKTYYHPDRAVHAISHRDARCFVDWRNRVAEERGEPWVYALPTEWQWEKAARGVDGRAFPWGDRFDWNYCISHHHSTLRTADNADSCIPGREPRDTSVYGMRDAVGNMREFTDSVLAEGSKVHVLRGGEDEYFYSTLMSTTLRSYANPAERNWNFGVRLVRTPRR